MRLTRFLIIVMLWVGSLLSMPSPTVQAAPAAKPLAQQSMICSNQAIPAGWAVVQAYSGTCSPYINYTIQYVSQPMYICAVNLTQSIPAGWAVTQVSVSSVCSSFHLMYITPVTQPMHICAVNLTQSIPAGWAVTQVSVSSVCSSYHLMYITPGNRAMHICAVNMDRSIPESYVITQVSASSVCSSYHLMYMQPTSGTSMNVCAAKRTPSGWYVAANYGGGGVCGPYVNQLIRRY